MLFVVLAAQNHELIFVAHIKLVVSLEFVTLHRLSCIEYLLSYDALWICLEEILEVEPLLACCIHDSEEQPVFLEDVRDFVQFPLLPGEICLIGDPLEVSFDTFRSGANAGLKVLQQPGMVVFFHAVVLLSAAVNSGDSIGKVITGLLPMGYLRDELYHLCLLVYFLIFLPIY